jgi:iron complex outermembrane receptor protein
MPLNDTGNYALYSNQLLDPELIDNVNVNLGSTDVDSPTASATGSTVNYRSRNPTEDFHARVVGSTGDFGFMRIFGVVDTGNITKGGLRAWLAASKATNNVFRAASARSTRTVQLQDLPAAGRQWRLHLAGRPLEPEPQQHALDLSVNQNYGSRTVSSGSSGRYPSQLVEVFYYTVQLAATISATTCGTAGNIATTPPDTGNLRMNMRFTLSDKLLLTIDPSVQYVKANGGGTSPLRGDLHRLRAVPPPASSAAPIIGRDLNGDGDLKDW